MEINRDHYSYRDLNQASEERLTNALYCMNTEIKTVTLLHLLRNAPQSAYDLRRAMVRTFGNIPQIPNATSIREACEEIFLPRGIVSKVIFNNGSPSKYGYSLTSEGEEIYVPQAAFRIDRVVMTGESMYTTLGFNSSKGKTTSPINRFKLLETIGCYDEITEKELAILTGIENGALVKHLQALEKLDYINFTSIGKNGDRKDSFNVSFKENGADLPKVHGLSPESMAKIYDTLKQYGVVNRDNLASTTGKNVATINSALRALLNSGHAIHAEGSWGNRGYSSIKPLPKLNDFVINQALPLRDASQKGPWLRRMREEYLMPLRESPELLTEWGRKALICYSKASPHINKMTPKERTLQIQELFREKAELTLHDIAQNLGVSTSTALRNISVLEKVGQVRKDKNGNNENRYVWVS